MEPTKPIINVDSIEIAKTAPPRQKEDHEYSNYELHYCPPSKYEIIKKIGRGKYSDVFKGINVENSKFCAIKILLPSEFKIVKKAKIKREVMILEKLSKLPNIIQLYDVIKDPVTKVNSLAFEYIKGVKLDNVNLSKINSVEEIKFYFYELLKAIDFAHSKGIMHRDIKPHNIMIDLEKKTLKLIDWGLAEIYHPNQQYNVKVCTRYYKSPELLLNYKLYNQSVDIWGLGCMLASAIFQKEPFFQGKDLTDQIYKIVSVLGTDDLKDYIDKFHIEVEVHLFNFLGIHSKKPFSKFINAANEKFATNEALDLLSKLLVIDHTQRISAKEALNHPFFSPIKSNQ